jgi:hypothetical protein
MADQGGLQLLPEARKRLEIKVPGQRRFFNISISVFILVAAAAAGSWYYKGKLEEEFSVLDVQLENIDKARDRSAEDRLFTLNRQLRLVSGFLNEHVFWSAGFRRLEKILKPAVQLENVSVSLDNKEIQFRAVAKDFVTISKLLASFASEDGIIDVNLNESTLLPQGVVSFNVKVKFDRAKFLKK